MVHRYITGPDTLHWGRPDRNTPSNVLLVILDAVHYFHLRICERPKDQRCDLESVKYMSPRATSLPVRPTTLSLDQPDPLTTIVSGPVGNCCPGHNLYCPEWAEACCINARPLNAEWRFHMDGREEAEAIPPQELGHHPTTPNVCPIFLFHQIRVLAREQLPTIYHQTQARAAYAALMTEMFSALRSAPVPLANLPEPQPQATPDSGVNAVRPLRLRIIVPATTKQIPDHHRNRPWIPTRCITDEEQ